MVPEKKYRGSKSYLHLVIIGFISLIILFIIFLVNSNSKQGLFKVFLKAETSNDEQKVDRLITVNIRFPGSTDELNSNSNKDLTFIRPFIYKISSNKNNEGYQEYKETPSVVRKDLVLPYSYNKSSYYLTIPVKIFPDKNITLTVSGTGIISDALHSPKFHECINYAQKTFTSLPEAYKLDLGDIDYISDGLGCLPHRFPPEDGKVGKVLHIPVKFYDLGNNGQSNYLSNTPDKYLLITNLYYKANGPKNTENYQSNIFDLSGAMGMLSNRPLLFSYQIPLNEEYKIPFDINTEDTHTKINYTVWIKGHENAGLLNKIADCSTYQNASAEIDAGYEINFDPLIIRWNGDPECVDKGNNPPDADTLGLEPQISPQVTP